MANWRPAVLYNLANSNWLTLANGTAAHYSAIHCPRQDIPPPQPATRSLPTARKLYYSFPVTMIIGGWVGLSTSATCWRLLTVALDIIRIESTMSIRIRYATTRPLHAVNIEQRQTEFYIGRLKLEKLNIKTNFKNWRSKENRFDEGSLLVK